MVHFDNPTNRREQIGRKDRIQAFRGLCRVGLSCFSRAMEDRDNTETFPGYCDPGITCSGALPCRTVIHFG